MKIKMTFKKWYNKLWQINKISHDIHKNPKTYFTRKVEKLVEDRVEISNSDAELTSTA